MKYCYNTMNADVFLVTRDLERRLSMKNSLRQIVFLLVICVIASAAFVCLAEDAAPTQADALSISTPAPNDLPDGYDPGSEEGGDDYQQGLVYDQYGNVVRYAGSTPIPLDPIDMPTPTPRPELTFSYISMTADRLGLKFEGPGTWDVDDSQADVFTLTDPNTLDNVNATLTLKITHVASSYQASNVKTDLANELSAMGQYNYTTWEASSAEKRTLVGKEGYYASYRGVYTDGTIVRGRVHMVLLDGNRLLTVTLNCPGWYNSSYVNVYTRFRNTVALAK